MLPRDTQTAPGARRAGSGGLDRSPRSVRPSTSHLQLDPTLEGHARTADGTVERDALHLQPRVLQVWRPAYGVLQGSCLLETKRPAVETNRRTGVIDSVGQ